VYSFLQPRKNKDNDRCWGSESFSHH